MLSRQLLLERRATFASLSRPNRSKTGFFLCLILHNRLLSVAQSILEKIMATPARELLQESAHALHLDDAVDEVFRLMMGASCLPTDESVASGTETITAVIGLAEAMSGAC